MIALVNSKISLGMEADILLDHCFSHDIKSTKQLWFYCPGCLIDIGKEGNFSNAELAESKHSGKQNILNSNYKEVCKTWIPKIIQSARQTLSASIAEFVKLGIELDFSLKLKHTPKLHNVFHLTYKLLFSLD